MVEAIRKLVSGNRRRLHEDNFSLDLTYIIPDRLIAMSYPSSGFESLYRNSIDKVSLRQDVNIFVLSIGFCLYKLKTWRKILFD